MYNIRKCFGDEYEWKSLDVIEFVKNNNDETYSIEKLNDSLKNCAMFNYRWWWINRRSSLWL